MHSTVTLQPKDFRNIHNALCDLRSIRNDVDGILSTQISKRINRVIQQLEIALRDAYDQETREDEKQNQHYQEVENELGNLKSIWSLYEVRDLRTDHYYRGARELLYKDHWGTNPIRVNIQGTLWKDLWLAADQAIQLSGDTHHIFVESFHKSKDEPGVLILSTGS